MNEKRSSTDGNAQIPLFAQPPADGVGGRQPRTPPVPRGGGYPETCTVFKFSGKKNATRDPRLDELRRMGLQRVWLEVAETIGVDNFLAMWRVLDVDPACGHAEGYLKITLKHYRSFLRYQRNRFIETLAAAGCTEDEIQVRLRAQLCETVSLRHIKRLAKGG